MRVAKNGNNTDFTCGLKNNCAFQIYKELINLIWGETKGQSRLGKGDGAICPGPEFSLILALLSALHWKWPERRQKGLPLSKAKPLVFISQDGNAFMENICQLVGKLAIFPESFEKLSKTF